MMLSKRQKHIIYGIILGDGYLQPTGQKNARLRVEHSATQKHYIDWIYDHLNNVFTDKPKYIVRKHPKTKRYYKYYRLQSNSSPVLGKLRRAFYESKEKIIPDNISKYLQTNLTLAIWYMDDGYYYSKDKSAHFYLPLVNEKSQQNLLKCLKDNYGLEGKIYCRPDRKACQLNLRGENKDNLFSLIKPYILQEFNYKLPFNPVSTESEK